MWHCCGLSTVFISFPCRNAWVRPCKEVFHTENKATQARDLLFISCLTCNHQCTALGLYDLEWSSRLFSPAGCVRNILRLSLPCPSLPAQRAGIRGGAWRWCPIWRTCTATQRRTTTSSTTERTRSYTLRTSQCQVSVDPGSPRTWFGVCDVTGRVWCFKADNIHVS